MPNTTLLASSCAKVRAPLFMFILAEELTRSFLPGYVKELLVPVPGVGAPGLDDPMTTLEGWLDRAVFGQAGQHFEPGLGAGIGISLLLRLKAVALYLCSSFLADLGIRQFLGVPCLVAQRLARVARRLIQGRPSPKG